MEAVNDTNIKDRDNHEGHHSSHISCNANTEKSISKTNKYMAKVPAQFPCRELPAILNMAENTKSTRTQM